MFDFLRAPDLKHFIDDGKVYCPSRNADVELDACAACRWLQHIEQNGKTPFVDCDPRPWPFEYRAEKGS